MDLRAITDLEGGRLQSDRTSPDHPWDPGDPTAHIVHPSIPPSIQADGRARLRNRGEARRVPKSGHRGAGHDADLNDHLGADSDDGSDVPFVPHRSSSDPRFRHPSDPHATHATHTSSVHAPSRAIHIAAHLTHRGNLDRDRGIGVSTTSARAQIDRRRARPEGDDPGDGGEEHERYLSRPRHCSTEPDRFSKYTPPHSPLKRTSRHRSPPSLNPDSDSASSQPLPITELPSHSSPRRVCDVGGDELDRPQRCDERRQRSPTRGEDHPAGLEQAHTRASGFAKGRSSSIESADEWSQNSAPPQPSLQPAENKMTVPSASPTSASQPAPDAGSFGMISDKELADETIHLRALLGCAPGAPVGLDVLADPPPGEKPNYPLPTLIKLAIYGSPRRRLTLQEIYQALEDRFEWFRQRTDELSWKNSIRHNLSLRKCFLKVQRPITEPGKGSYWMIDLTQGEGNKRVRKRNKKPTKTQLAAQAYCASARLPGQGDGPRPTPYPMPSRAHPQPHIVEDESGDDNHHAPLMQTNFTTGEELHHSLLRDSTTRHTTPPEISSRQRPRSEQLYQSAPADHASQSHYQKSLQPLTSSRDIIGLDTNIDPSLNITTKDGLHPHAVVGQIAASHHDIIPQRGAPMPGMQSPTMQLTMPLDMPLTSPAPQVTLPHPLPAPSSATYHHQLSPRKGTMPHSSLTVSASHMPTNPPSLLQQRQPTRALLQPDALRQLAPQQPALTQAQPPRLPPMRTLSASPRHAAPSPQPAPSLGGGIRGSPKHPPASTDGFARFATHLSTGLAKPTFGKPAFIPISLVSPMRPLVLSENKGKRRAECGGEGNDHAGDDELRGSYGNRRHFVRPSPRAGIEYEQRSDGGLITARRTSEQDIEGTVQWLNRLEHEESRGADADFPSPDEHAS